MNTKKKLLSALTALMLAVNSAAVTVSAAETGEEVTNEEIITEKFITEDQAEVMDLDGMETDIADDINSTVRSAGDVNKDGSIDSLDATKILINYAKYLNNGGKKPSTGDTNGDGIADSRDATAILIYYAEQLLKEAASSYPKTITNDFSESYSVGVARTGKLNKIHYYNIDSDPATEAILEYTQSGYLPFYLIYNNGTRVKNPNGNTYIFSDYSPPQGSICRFLLMKLHNGSYRAAYYHIMGSSGDKPGVWFYLTDVLSQGRLYTASYDPYYYDSYWHKSYPEERSYKINDSEVSYNALRTAFSNTSIITSSKKTSVSAWLKNLDLIKRGCCDYDQYIANG